MPTAILPPDKLFVLNPADFREATLNWIQTIERPTADSHKIFESGGVQLKAVSFPVDAVIALLSTIRVHFIEARFLVIDGRFSIALYATDVNHVRLSAYYQAYSWWTTPVMETPASSFTGTDQAPYALVHAWTTAWADVPPAKLEPKMFITSYGTLEGYSFKAADFMQPLFEAREQTELDIRVDLCLHEYYPAVTEGDPQVQQTFGLVLRLSPRNPDGQGGDLAQRVAALPAGTPFFDLSTPCPPGT